MPVMLPTIANQEATSAKQEAMSAKQEAMSVTTESEMELLRKKLEIKEQEKLKIGKAGVWLYDTNEKLKSKIKDQEKYLTQLQMSREEMKEQKPVIDELKKKKHDKLVDLLIKENKSLQQEKEQLEKRYGERKKCFKKIVTDFEDFKMNSQLLERDLMKKSKGFEEIDQSVLGDLRRERDELLAKCNTNEQLTNQAELKFRELEKKIQQPQENLEQEAQYKSQFENNAYFKLAKGLAEYNEKLQKKKETDTATVEEQQDEIEFLKRRLSAQGKDMIIMASSQGNVLFKTEDGQPMVMPEHCAPSETCPFQGENLGYLSINSADETCESMDTDAEHVEISDPEENDFHEEEKTIPSEKEYFALTCLSVKINSGHNMDDLMTISMEELWKKALEEKVEFHQYHKWLELQIYKMYYQHLANKNSDLQKF